MITPAQLAYRVIVVHLHPLTRDEVQSMAFVTREWWHLPGKTQYADLMTFPNRCGQQMMLDVPICSCLEVCVRRFRETRFPQAFVNPSLI